MILAAITTCKRKPDMVERALKSVIAQTYADWNLVVFDDSPADWEFRSDVKKMVESYAANDKRIRYVAHDRNYGAQRARNNALKIADEEGFEFIAYLDDDDEWLPEKLEKQLAKIQECDEDVALVNGGFVYINEMENYSVTLTPTPQKAKRLKLFQRAAWCGPTSSPLIRTKHLIAAGGFDEKLQGHQEWECFIRLLRLYGAEFINEPLFIYHVHKGERTGMLKGRYILALEYIISKNLQYLENNKDEYYNQLAELFLRSSKMSLSVWCKMARLKPLQVIRSLCILMKPLLPINFHSVRNLLAKNFPALLHKLRMIKHKL